MSPVAPRSLLSSFALLLLGSAMLATPADAQRKRKDYSYRPEGGEQCQEIWDEYGRMSWGEGRAVYCEVRDLGTLPARSTITVEGGESNGVRARGGARQATQVRLVIQANGSTVAEARELARRVTLDLAANVLEPTGTGGSRGARVAAIVELLTPEQANLTLSTENGPLDVQGVRGAMKLRVNNGPLAMRGVGGDVHARANNGPISIELTGSKWDGAGLDAEAQNGPVSLSIPRDYSAELEVGTENGPFDGNYPMTISRFSTRHLTTTLGKGGAKVRAMTENGPMSIRTAGSRNER